MNERQEVVIAKTLIPNSVIIFSGIFLISSSLIIAYSENMIAILIYPIILGIVLFAIWTFKSKYDCILVLTEDRIRVKYFHPMLKNQSFLLKDIKSNIKVERYNGRVFIGGFTTIQDYLNYRWYFTSEEYVFSFSFGIEDDMIEIFLNPI